MFSQSQFSQLLQGILRHGKEIMSCFLIRFTHQVEFSSLIFFFYILTLHLFNFK